MMKLSGKTVNLTSRRAFSVYPSPTSKKGPVKRNDLAYLGKKYEGKTPISMMTAYDSAMAQAMNDSVDIVLVGDSGGMVSLGYENTLPVSMGEMILLSQAVSRTATRPLLLGDLPFGSYLTVDDALRSTARFVKEGGMQGVKVEGGRSQAAKVAAIAREGMLVMGHVGLLPQTAVMSSGFTLQGRTADAALRIVEDALEVEAAGAFSSVLEMVPHQLSAFITDVLRTPTIGIGAGPLCSGQVLVSYDVLGMYNRFSPIFVEKRADFEGSMRRAFGGYAHAVHSGRFPRTPVAPLDPLHALDARALAVPRGPDGSPLSSRTPYREMGLAELEALQTLLHRNYPEQKHALARFDALVALAQDDTLGTHSIAGTVGLLSLPCSKHLHSHSSPNSESATERRAGNVSTHLKHFPEELLPVNLREASAFGRTILQRLARAHVHLPADQLRDIFVLPHSPAQQPKEPHLGPRVAVVGSGPVACAVAGMLSRTHEEVFMVVGDSSQSETLHSSLGRRGLGLSRVSSPSTSAEHAHMSLHNVRCVRARDIPQAPASSSTVSEDFTHSFDLVLLCGRAGQAAEQAATAAQLLRRADSSGEGGGLVIPLYNGADSLETVESVLHTNGVFTPSQLAYGNLSFGAAIPSPATPLAETSKPTSRSGKKHAKENDLSDVDAVITGGGALHIALPLLPRRSIQLLQPFLQAYAPSLSPPKNDIFSGISAHLHPFAQTESVRWRKLAVNAVMNPVVALAGVSNGGFRDFSQEDSASSATIAALALEAAHAADAATRGFALHLRDLLIRSQVKSPHDWQPALNATLLCPNSDHAALATQLRQDAEEVAANTAPNVNSQLAAFRALRGVVSGHSEAENVSGVVSRVLKVAGVPSPASDRALFLLNARDHFFNI